MNTKLKQEDIICELKRLSNKYGEIKFGLAGSYVNGTFNSSSDVDVILDANETVMGNIDINVDICRSLEKAFNRKIDLIWLKLLKDDSDYSDRKAKELGIGINNNTPYRTIMREVQWVE